MSATVGTTTVAAIPRRYHSGWEFLAVSVVGPSEGSIADRGVKRVIRCSRRA
jgi:hypothetical protein